MKIIEVIDQDVLKLADRVFLKLDFFCQSLAEIGLIRQILPKTQWKNTQKTCHWLINSHIRLSHAQNFAV